MQIVAIDIGFGFTKASDGKETVVFKSLYGDAPEIQFWMDFGERALTDYFHVTVDGKSYEKAASWLDKALRINGSLGGTSAAVCFNMGFIYYHAGRKQKALDRLTRALQIEPTYQRAKELIEKCQE